MPAFDKLQRAGFDGLEFPIKTVRIRGRYRHHVHEYLRVPGGVIEKLERGLYMVEMEAVFDVNIKGYGQLWPNTLVALRGKFEQGVTSELVIPTVGSIPALQPEWDQETDMARVRSGESVRLQFLEDQTQLFLSEALAKVDASSVDTSVTNLAAIRKQLADPNQDASIFDAIQDAANSVLAIKDQSDLVGGLLAAKIDQLSSLIAEADRAAESLKDPVNYELLNALHELWDSTITLGLNLAESPRGPRVYNVPRTMSVGDIASEIYGNTDRAAEIMLNNDFEDPFAVPAGIQVVYFIG